MGLHRNDFDTQSGNGHVQITCLRSLHAPNVAIADVNQPNGAVHVVNKDLAPKGCAWPGRCGGAGALHGLGQKRGGGRVLSRGPPVVRLLTRARAFLGKIPGKARA